MYDFMSPRRGGMFHLAVAGLFPLLQRRSEQLELLGLPLLTFSTTLIHPAVTVNL
jgi:hypothetical protein